jgi:hypothetical protein
MTEARWRRGNDPTRLLDLLRGRASERKLRLFGCACCRLVQEVFPDAECHVALEVAERYADRRANDEELQKAHHPVNRARDLSTGTYHTFEEYKSRFVRAVAFALHALTAPLGGYHSEFFGDQSDPDMVWGVVKDASEWLQYARLKPRENKKAQATLLRDVFSNPFRPVHCDPRWLSPTALALAQTIYNDRTFDRLPILADALEDAGCTDAAILDHLRGPGPHVRGCFALDLVLGKS